MESTPSQQQAAPEQTQNGSAGTRSQGFPATKIGVFVVVATIIAAGAFFGTQAFLLDDDAADDNRRAVAVQSGTLLDEVTASGSVEFPELESMRFDISGNVGEILVEEGDEVTAGMPLVELDGVTIAALESELAAAEIELENAGEELAELLGGVTELERATLEKAVASAEINLQNAKDDRADLLNGVTDLDRATAASDLADARVTTATAAEALAEFTGANGTDSPATATSKEALSDANDALADAIVASEDDAKSQAELVADAQETFDDTASDYSGQITAWFGSVVTTEDRSLSPSDLAEKWNATVDEIFAESVALVDSPLDDPNTPWNEPVVWAWTHLIPVAIETNCEITADLARCPSVEISDSWDVRVAEQESLGEAVADAASAVTTQQKLIEAARDVVETTADDIVETTNSTDIGALAATLDEAIERETDFETTFNELNDVDQLQLILAATAINLAAAELDNALQDLAEAGLEAPTASSVGQDPGSGGIGALDLLQVKLATAAVNKAKADLDLAVEQLAGIRLVAPNDGVITSISVVVGDPVNRNTAVLDIVDLDVVTVEAAVDEIDVLLLRVGDEVAVVLDALPGQVLEGTVEVIGDGLNVQGVIEFPFTVALIPPDGVELIEGLSATATIVINRIDNALLIPLQSLGGSFAQPTVDVVIDSGFVTTPVTLGASDDFWVIVDSGLTEGQQVLMEVVESVDPFQQFFGGGGAIRIQRGGGFTGGGGFGGGGRGGGGQQGGPN
ncbi:MAG: efflux RND transporter periplasmic adaptor subunit [Dehalococcoidia bacterium]|nr:efflux RND transporter periplasmic adaptor subunit [Dehalococcoidia bacterium]